MHGVDFQSEFFYANELAFSLFYNYFDSERLLKKY